jgi:hypothetical protein
MEGEIINRVASSGLITLDLADFMPEGEGVFYDLKDNLWEGIALKEKDFRQFLKENDWSVYKNKYVALGCTADAIIPKWAYMLLASVIAPHAKQVVFGHITELEEALLLEALDKLEPEDYRDARVVVKGCGEKEISPSAYIKITALLQPVVKTLMFGEPCSTVPVYKQPRKKP